MRFFLDTEFIEGPQRKRILGIPVGYTKPTIDLISIGIVSENGNEYFALSNEFNIKEAWNRYEIQVIDGKETKVYWLRENVLLPIYKKYIVGDSRNKMKFNIYAMHYIMINWGQSNEEIADEIECFVNSNCGFDSKPVFFGYYSDYDWVVFCWLFGKMIELPEGFPMLCYDVKQLLDEKCKKLKIADVEKHADYPIPSLIEHDALEDAIWTKELYKFTTGLTVWRSKTNESNNT